jgi:hypothetical protein
LVSKIADRCACELPQDIPLRLLSYTWRRSSTQFCREALCASLVSWLRGVRVVRCCLVGTNDSCPLNSGNSIWRLPHPRKGSRLFYSTALHGRHRHWHHQLNRHVMISETTWSGNSDSSGLPWSRHYAPVFPSHVPIKGLSISRQSESAFEQSLQCWCDWMKYR